MVRMRSKVHLVAARKTTQKAITIKHLAYELAEQHKLSNKQGLVLMEDLVEKSTPPT